MIRKERYHRRLPPSPLKASRPLSDSAPRMPATCTALIRVVDHPVGLPLSTAIESCTGLAIENCILGGGDEPLVRAGILGDALMIGRFFS